jgi:hypothetical protein
MVELNIDGDMKNAFGEARTCEAGSEKVEAASSIMTSDFLIKRPFLRDDFCRRINCC